MNQTNKPDLDFCREEKLTLKQEFVCDQDELHKSMLDNPLSFVLFYLFAIIFGALLFQLSQRKFKKKDKPDK